jgi:hypothetical protein
MAQFQLTTSLAISNNVFPRQIIHSLFAIPMIFPEVDRSKSKFKGDDPAIANIIISYITIH